MDQASVVTAKTLVKIVLMIILEWTKSCVTICLETYVIPIINTQFLCFQTQRHGSGFGSDSLNLSQDSLDDNIGVDQVMCFRLLGNICDSYNKYSIFCIFRLRGMDQVSVVTAKTLVKIALMIILEWIKSCVSVCLEP